ncbi:hypothetical protein, partial [Klebsiella pneumoniae]|uniref:hypothetical protein n=1 Tax=Klebsiella pneumoniae TaxID=573 RepID=UPI00200F07FA
FHKTKVAVSVQDFSRVQINRFSTNLYTKSSLLVKALKLGYVINFSPQLFRWQFQEVLHSPSLIPSIQQ